MKKKRPELRFSGFDNDWEQRKLLDVAPLQRGFDLPASQMKEGKYPVVMSNGIGGLSFRVQSEGARYYNRQIWNNREATLYRGELLAT